MSELGRVRESRSSIGTFMVWIRKKEGEEMEELLGGEGSRVYIRRTLEIRYKACPISAALALTRIRWENLFCGCRKSHFCGVGGGKQSIVLDRNTAERQGTNVCVMDREGTQPSTI